MKADKNEMYVLVVKDVTAQDIEDNNNIKKLIPGEVVRLTGYKNDMALVKPHSSRKTFMISVSCINTEIKIAKSAIYSSFGIWKLRGHKYQPDK